MWKCKHFLVRDFAYFPAQNYALSVSIFCVSIHIKYSIGNHASFTVSLRRYINPGRTDNILNRLKYWKAEVLTCKKDSITFHFSGKNISDLSCMLPVLGERPLKERHRNLWVKNPNLNQKILISCIGRQME